MYMHINHCHRVTAHLQSNILLYNRKLISRKECVSLYVTLTFSSCSPIQPALRSQLSCLHRANSCLMASLNALNKESNHRSLSLSDTLHSAHVCESTADRQQ